MTKPYWTKQLPKRWSVERLRHVVEIANSNVDKKSYDDGSPVRLCNYTDVYYNEYITDDLDFMNATATPSEIQRFKLGPGDVIITKDSESWDDIAVPACVGEELVNVVCGYHLTLMRTKRRQMTGRFLLRALQAQGVKEQFWLAANGVTRFGLGQQGMKDALLPVPPISIQNTIVSFLDEKTAQIDELIAKKEQLIELLEEKRAALINRAVTKGLNPDVPMKDSGVPWIGEIPQHWDVSRLGFLADEWGGSTPAKDNMDYWKGEIPWVSPKDMKTFEICGSQDHVTEAALAQLTLLPPSCVLMVVRGMILARTVPIGITTVPVTINQDMKALCPRQGIEARFLAFSLVGFQESLLSHVEESGHGTKALRSDQWRQFSVPVPTADEQREIVVYIEGAERKRKNTIRKLESQVSKLVEYRQSLITAAVTGQIDVTEEPTDISEQELAGATA